MAEHVTADSEQIQPILPSPDRLNMRYDGALDTLFISTQPPLPAVSVEINGEIWVRFVPATAEVVGVEIEDFEASCSPHLLPIAARWRGRT